ncbi:MAG: RsmD family RNA methyltransferase [Candidatus Caldarchaeum sp.]
MQSGLRPINAILLSGYEVQQILAQKSNDVSLDLGMSLTKVFVTEAGVQVGEKLLSWDVLHSMSERPEDVYLIGEKISKLAWFDRSYYRLVVPGFRQPPTVEINGIRMHRTVDISPLDDAKAKVSLFDELLGKTVLDICTGLGYTAISEIGRGAEKVVTVEHDVNVLRMAAYNPWSRALFQPKIDIVVYDAVRYLEKCDVAFDAVMHDPPTYKIAGHLYSMELYTAVYNVMRRGAVLVHYVGQPGIKRGVQFYRGVLNRLRKAGFKPIYIPEVQCVKAFKL